ncbi:MAG: 4-hydroxythreonine-4-phosphate dehydrogenase [Helicobacteraceae bacterium]|jgi:4-hydroxythreonine-4-phosphate dehydrogenase|nr:4-hydroxythreonine-4-phosphate dehydrogenase [Helicobacteraceae bacterium]
MKKIAISIGDLNGIGFEIALKAHSFVKERCVALYCVSPQNAERAAKKMGATLPKDFNAIGGEKPIEIRAGEIDANAGEASFASFVQAIDLVSKREADAIVTLPINKASWSAAGLKYKGHTDYLRDRVDKNAVMLIGAPKRYVAFFTDHIALRAVADRIALEPLSDFLVRFYKVASLAPIGVLGLNPHNGDCGAIGSEEAIIERAIKKANETLNLKAFEGAIVPDTAFAPKALERYKIVVAMYHDQGLSPLKTLFFEESINVTLGLPFTRTSVDHGTAFDIAYRDQNPSIVSYQNAVLAAINGVFTRS